MPSKKLEKVLLAAVADLEKEGRAKGAETVITKVLPGNGRKGLRFRVSGEGNKQFIIMNSNSYLGLFFDKRLARAAHAMAVQFGVGPGAVRFISGTRSIYPKLEAALTAFHRSNCDLYDTMLTNSAYTSSLGVLAPLINDLNNQTAVLTDALNHNCIINGLKVSKPRVKSIYRHNYMADIKRVLQGWVSQNKKIYDHLNAIGQPDFLTREKRSQIIKRVVVITDGVFSMRGDQAPLKKIQNICRKYNKHFEDGIILVIDDSHGVGALGRTGRGTEEYCEAEADILIGTLGKAFGVNGGYVVARRGIIRYLRETCPTYIYSNPITPPEAAAALKALKIVDSSQGRQMLKQLLRKTRFFESGLSELGYETIPGDHPVVPLVTRNTELNNRLSRYLYDNMVLATALPYPVVPKGDDEIRFQINASHTIYDLKEVLRVLKKFKKENNL